MPGLAPAVKVAVRVVPEPAMTLNVPPAVVISLSINPIGASLNVKVMVVLAAAFKSAADDVMVTVGATVSMVMVGVSPAPPRLPASSV